MMESQIRESLAKLDQLIQLIPDGDPRTTKAKTDLAEMNTQFGEVVFVEQLERPEGVAVEEQEAKESEVREMRTKKLMTLVKSKYFMLKANFPK